MARIPRQGECLAKSSVSLPLQVTWERSRHGYTESLGACGACSRKESSPASSSMWLLACLDARLSFGTVGCGAEELISQLSELQHATDAEGRPRIRKAHSGCCFQLYGNFRRATRRSPAQKQTGMHVRGYERKSFMLRC